MSLFNPNQPQWPAAKAFPPDPSPVHLPPMRGASRDELVIETHELKKEVAMLKGQVEAFLQQEQHTLRVFEYVLKVAWYDIARQEVRVGYDDLYSDELGEEFLRVVQENTEKMEI